MSRDIFDDRLGFAAARHAFVMKRPLGSTTVTQPVADPPARRLRTVHSLPIQFHI